MTALQVKKEQRKKVRPGKVKFSSSNQERVVKTKSGFKRATSETVYVNGEVKNAVTKRAKEIEASLPRNFPTMIKLMLPSHVSGGFWLGLAKKFCSKHMVKEDEMIDLEDEDGGIFSVKYLADKQGLSGGWRGFSIYHKLVHGDLVVFQLVKANKFMVYIVRASDSEENDAALGLLKLDSSLEERSGSEEEDGNYQPEGGSESGRSDGIDCGFDLLDGIRMSSSDTAANFEQVKSFDDFDIIANGLVINCELSKHLQRKYYELCSSRKSFLHGRILNGLNCKLIAGVIAETINIADGIRASKLVLHKKEEFATWESTLSAFEKLGMEVEFMLARLRKVMRLCDRVDKCKRLEMERDEVREEVKDMEAKLEESVGRMRRIDEEMERLEVEDVEVKFRELVEAPWSV